jgi:hypothetical protein
VNSVEFSRGASGLGNVFGRRISRAEFFRLSGSTAAISVAGGLLTPSPAAAANQMVDPNDANVKSFGAVGDGLTDDTAAIQAAVNASFGVYIPAGIYKCTATISLRSGSRLVGEASGSAPGIPATQLDFSTFNYGRALQGPPSGGGNGHGVTLSNVWIKGAAALVPEIEGFPTVGYYAQSQNSGLSIVNTSITGFTINCVLDSVYTTLLLNLCLSDSVRNNLLILGGCLNVRVFSCDFTVPNEAGKAAPSAQVANIWLSSSAAGRPRSISVQGCIIDEVARLGQTILPATVCIDGAEDVFLSQSVIWVPVNDGSGYGVKVGPGSARVTLRDVRVEPYEADANHRPVNTIFIDQAASGVVLSNVTSDANGGGDIADNASDTVWVNVNGGTKFRGGVAAGAVDVLPPPTSSIRGQLLRVRGGATTADSLHLCIQSTADTFSWIQLMSGLDVDALSLAIVVRERRLPGMLAGLQNWYDLSEAKTYSAVPDLSGNGRATDHRYGNLDPVAATDPASFGGKRFARFDGRANRALVAPSALSGTGLTVMFVGRVALGASNTGRLFAVTDNNGPDFSRAASCLVYHSAADVLTSYRNAALTSSSLADGTPFALLVTYDGQVNRHQVTEGSESGGVASVGAFGAVDLVIGGGKQIADVVGAYSLACDVVEVAVWNRRLAQADLVALGTYARRWWNL